MVEGVTFDFWNTLMKERDAAKTARLRLQRIEEVLLHRGFKREENEVKDAMRKSWEIAAYKQRACGYDITPRGHVELMLQFLSLPAFPELTEEMYAAYTTVLKEEKPVLNDGAKEVLDYLKGRCRLGLICNTGATPGVILREFMREHGIFDYFDIILFSDEMKWAKPNPLIFTYALKEMNVSGSRSVHVGDDPLTDVIGAKKAGMKAAWLAPYADWPVPECDWHLRELIALMNIVEEC